MVATKNDIPAAKRTKVADILARLLVDAIDLKSQAKQAHWNVKGENFMALHELFDKVSSEVEDAVDLIAERIIQLGGEAEGTVRIAAHRSRLKEYPHRAADGQKHADALSSVIAAFNCCARKNIDDTASLGDAVTADMLTEITRGLDKLLWFIEAHLKAK
jgi:starvation-inducible DNA-binding protein